MGHRVPRDLKITRAQGADEDICHPHSNSSHCESRSWQFPPQKPNRQENDCGGYTVYINRLIRYKENDITKSAILLIGLIALLCTAAPAGDLPWFDMEKCTFCKHLTAEEGLIEHMVFEYYNHSKGIISIIVVDKDYQDVFARVSNEMEATSEKIFASKESPPYMCGHCVSYGEFVMAGVTPEIVSTSQGEMTLWITDNPEMVARLHAFAKRSTEEFAKMCADKAE